MIRARLRTAGTAALLGALLFAPLAEAGDRARIEALTARWTAAWDVGAGPFDAAVFRELFAPGPEAITVFDNVQGDVLVITGVEDYAATWEPFMAPLAHWSVMMEDLEVTVAGELAYTTFRLVGTDTRGPDGEPIPFGQYGTHVWRKLPDLGWRLVHEHLTAYDVEGREEEH